MTTTEINGKSHEIQPGANLTGANLYGANLTRANLTGANLTGANLTGANLDGASLDGANLTGASLYAANLYGANLTGANLTGANLYAASLDGASLDGASLDGASLTGASLDGASLDGASLDGASLDGASLYAASLDGANLDGANLTGANLYGAKNLSDLVLARLSILPDEGDVIGWKKAYHLDEGSGVLVKLRIPAEAKRSNATRRKCRAEYAEVLEVIGADSAISGWDSAFVYRPGETVRPTRPFEEDRFIECAPGIHFFITRAEAENYDN